MPRRSSTSLQHRTLHAANRLASVPSPPLVGVRYAIGGDVVAVTLHEPHPDVSRVPEALVQDLWAMQRFDRRDLSTPDGTPVRVINPGTLNTDAGPDFSGAHVQLDGLDWHGDVEIHVSSQGWYDHGHHEDPRYDCVVLHVTLHPDVWTGRLERSDGSVMPEVVLAPRLQTPLRTLLRAFYTRDPDDLVCAPQWDDVPDELRSDWIAALAGERLDRKVDRLRARLDDGAALEEVLVERLFAGLGYAKNDAPMVDLVQRLSLDRLRRLGTLDREALLFGVAGLLPEPSDLLDADRPTADAAMDLRDRFARLQAVVPVPPMSGTAWTYFRLRPNNVPPLRLAQAAAWFEPGGLLDGDPLAALRSATSGDASVPALRTALEAVPRPFWRTHYRLTTTTKDHDPSLGRTRIDTLIVNAVVPVLVLDARRRGLDQAEQRARDVLHHLPARRDSVVRRFRDLGTRARTAAEAQGQHQLFREYCSTGGCLQCRIGTWLLEQ